MFQQAHATMDISTCDTVKFPQMFFSYWLPVVLCGHGKNTQVMFHITCSYDKLTPSVMITTTASTASCYSNDKYSA